MKRGVYEAYGAVVKETDRDWTPRAVPPWKWVSSVPMRVRERVKVALQLSGPEAEGFLSEPAVTTYWFPDPDGTAAVNSWRQEPWTVRLIGSALVAEVQLTVKDRKSVV